MSAKRTLFIVRHAKSSWDMEGISDIDRPLKLRGVRDAYDMARRLKINRLMPDQIITSPANRALHTATIFERVFENKYLHFNVDERLYGVGSGVIKRIISQQTETVKHLMIFGHNPDFSELATILTGEAYIELPTCGICQVDFQMDSWKDISSKKAIGFSVDFPKKGVES